MQSLYGEAYPHGEYCQNKNKNDNKKNNRTITMTIPIRIAILKPLANTLQIYMEVERGSLKTTILYKGPSMGFRKDNDNTNTNDENDNTNNRNKQ